MNDRRYRSPLAALTLILALATLVAAPPPADAGTERILFHLKTGLKHDDAQLCVAYNEIWAALDAGLQVDVLVDADAVNTYKVGWRGKDRFEGYKMPERLRQLLASTFGRPLAKVPETYGAYLRLLHDLGAHFYINSAMLVVAKIEEQPGTVAHIGPQFFQPISLKEMVALRRAATYYTVY